MLKHTKRQVHKWKFLQHALSRYVYNRSLLFLLKRQLLGIGNYRDFWEGTPCPLINYLPVTSQANLKKQCVIDQQWTKLLGRMFKNRLTLTQD